MAAEPVFQQLAPERLGDIAVYLNYDPIVGPGARLLSALPKPERLAWLDRHRGQIEDEFCFAGSSLISGRRDYRGVVLAAAKKTGATHGPNASTPEVERAIVRRWWTQTLAEMTPAQRSEFERRADELLAAHKGRLNRELAAAGLLGAAQLSGFGVYLAASTLLGAVNGALGLGLGFGAFTGLSSLISVVIGPVGWLLLGVTVVGKLGGANFRKCIPVIALVAIHREAAGAEAANPYPPKSPPPKPSVILLPPSSVEATLRSKPSAPPARAVPDLTSERGSSPAALVTPIDRELYNALEAGLNRAARRARNFPRHNEPAPPPSTRQQKIAFDQRYHDLAAIALESAGAHYLDLRPTDKQAVQDLTRERKEAQEQQETHRKQNERRLARERRQKKVFVYRFGTWSGKGLIGAGLAVFWRRGPASADRGQCAAAA